MLESVQHASDSRQSLEAALDSSRRRVTEALAKFELGEQLALRTKSDIDVIEKHRGRASAGTFGDIRWDRDRGPAGLRAQRKPLVPGEVVSQLIDVDDEVHRVLPDTKFSEVGDWLQATNFKFQAVRFLEQIRCGACSKDQLFSTSIALKQLNSCVPRLPAAAHPIPTTDH